MKYPAILKINSIHIHQIVIAYNEKSVLNIEGEFNGWTSERYDASNATNITREHLENTYGRIESKEHAEFIIDLAKVNNLGVCAGSLNLDGNYFAFKNDGTLYFFNIENHARILNRKLITIPLPPKQIQTATSEEEFEMKQIMKNNGDNLVLGCEDSNCEWPCIGDEVHTNFGKGVVKLLPDSKFCYVIEINGNYHQLKHNELSKPKTLGEELRDDLIELYCTAGYETEKYIDLVMHKYNITKKPQ